MQWAVPSTTRSRLPLQSSTPHSSQVASLVIEKTTISFGLPSPPLPLFIPPGPPSPFDAPLRLDPPVVGVLHLSHLGHEVGDVDELLGRCPACHDDVLEAGPGGQDLHHLAQRHPPEGERVGELVENEQVVGLIGDAPPDLL